MILTQEQIDRIKDIIQNYFHVFIFQNVGPEQLDEQHMRQLAEQGVQLPSDSENLFKNAFIMGKTRGNAGPEELTNISYDEFLSQIFNRQIGTTNLDQTVVDSIKQGAAHYLHNLKNRAVDTIVGTILNENREAHMEQIGEEVKTSIEQAMVDSRNIQELVRELRDKTGDLAYDFNRLARTEIATAYNRGAVNAIVERNKEAGIKKEDILIYLSGPLDVSTCNYCKKFYHEGGSFKIYRLSELLANGTNIGKKQAQWQPTVPPLHPHCRHRPIELLPGWTLDENGRQVYVGPGHHELENNLSKSLKTPTYTGHKLQKRLKFQGMDISIENKKGSKRKWKDRYGNEGKTIMQNDYGYIRKTMGNDNDHVDCFIGPNLISEKVFIIHQNDPKTGKYDEDKVMLGFDDKKAAKIAYLRHYDNSKYFGSINEMNIDEFKEKVLGKKVDIIKSKLESLKNK